METQALLKSGIQTERSSRQGDAHALCCWRIKDAQTCTANRERADAGTGHHGRHRLVRTVHRLEARPVYTGASGDQPNKNERD
jgi:hypothetical protein